MVLLLVQIAKNFLHIIKMMKILPKVDVSMEKDRKVRP